MSNAPRPVRPTIRCLIDLGIKLPVINQALHEIGHALIAKAQRLPEEVAAQGGERVRFADDRVWFKVKIDDDRGMATDLDRPLPQDDPQIVKTGWWIGAAGKRRGGHASDFYVQMEAELDREGKGSGHRSSGHLLPTGQDIQRLRAESALLVVTFLQDTICKAIVLSLRAGRVVEVELTLDGIAGHNLRAMVRAQDGDAYLVISARGFVDPRMIAVAIAAVPGIPPADWLPEPGETLGIRTLSATARWSPVTWPMAPELRSANASTRLARGCTRGSPRTRQGFRSGMTPMAWGE